MMNEMLNYKIGTVLRETYEGKNYYYIIGDYFVYTNDYDSPQIRPYKFNDSECMHICNEEEKKYAIELFKKNHLIWNEETGKVTREYEEVTLSVKLKVQPGMNINKLLERLNDPHNEMPWYIYDRKYEDC